MRVAGDDGELRPRHYIYVYSIESRLIMKVRYDLFVLSARIPGALERVIDSGLVGRKVRSHEERRFSILGPTQSRISSSIL